ncbi:unnamed protein product [Diplocarpon coronariae]|nr:hypothetical protein JHW43_001379 [Diplocarpon mali]
MDGDSRPPWRTSSSSNSRSKRHQSLNLSVRTASHSTPPATKQDPTPQQPRLTYPLPIPKDKEARALDLYIAYCDAFLKEKVENSDVELNSATSHRDGYHLSVPGPPTAHSVTSYASSKYSLANPSYDNVTDLSSVVSFDDKDELASAAAKSEGELISFDGKKVKQRRRKRLDPVARAKAALVRYLVSCSDQNLTELKCPLDHHDIPLLEKLRQQRLEAERPRAGEDPGSSISNSSQQTATSLSTWQNTGPDVSQSNALMGVGTKLDLEQVSGNYTSQLDIQSPGEAAFGDILSDIPAPTVLDIATDLPIFSPNPYASYQDGQMIAIGVHRNGYFYCQHLDGLCHESFATDEDLQVHFETAHFAFTRIHPAHRLMCSSCNSLNHDMLSPCTNCSLLGTLELWVYGNFIPIPSFYPDAPGPQGVGSFTTDIVFSSMSYDSIDLQWDQDLNSGTFGGTMDTESHHFGVEGRGDAFGGSQYDYQASNPSSYSANFQGNFLSGAIQMAREPVSIHLVYEKARKSPQRPEHIVFLVLLGIIILGIDYYILAMDRLTTIIRVPLDQVAIAANPTKIANSRVFFIPKCGQTTPTTFGRL